MYILSHEPVAPTKPNLSIFKGESLTPGQMSFLRNEKNVYETEWSGARSLSTALMRAWENRPDTVVDQSPTN